MAAPEVDRHGDPLAPNVLLAEPGLPALDLRQGEGVVLVGTVAGVEPACRVAHRAGDAPDDRGQRLDLGVRYPWGCGRRSAFRPNNPVKPAGIRMEPPPSPPVPRGSSPPETDAAEPPDDPPGVRSRSYGFEVAPCRRV